MKVVLIEDEAIAMRMLRKVLLAVDNSIEIIAELESVADALSWFRNNEQRKIDIIFSDIQLSDGLSFDIFEQLSIKLPIIFTTAYNEYAIRAFKVNGIDYLLKPIKDVEIEAAIRKFKETKVQYSHQELVDVQQLIHAFQYSAQKPKTTFLVHQRDKIIPVQSDNIAWINTQNQMVTAMLFTNQKLHLDEKMEEVEKRLSSVEFFRANRQYIISRNAVIEAEQYFNNRLSVKLNPPAPETVVVSREKVSQFRNWLQGIV